MRKLLLLPALLLCVSCVSSGKYKALETQFSDLKSQLAQTNKEATGLQSDLGQAKASNESLNKDKTELQSQKELLESQKAELEKVKASLESKTGQLEQATNALKAQKDALEAEKAGLVREAQSKQAQYDSLVGDLKKELNDGQLKITQYKNMLTVDVADKILFDSGKADLKTVGKDVLKKVGEALAKSDKFIRVVGHTDNVPLIPGGTYASNWELSAARATVVVRFLQEQTKLDPLRLIAGGRGEYAPVAPNDTPANKQKNRRIEITLLDKALVEAVQVKTADEAGQAGSVSETAK